VLLYKLKYVVGVEF